LAEALAEGRTVVLNGFGRFETRRYPGPRKRVGLIFRPGARLRNRLNIRLLLPALALLGLALGPASSWAQEAAAIPDAPALVLDNPIPGMTQPDPNETGPTGPTGEVDLSAPGMTGSSGGTIPIMLVESAYLAHRRGDFQAAIDGYTRIIRRRGLTRRERAVSYLLRGEAQRDSGRLEAAVLDFTRALRQWPGYPAAHHFRGRIYEKLDKLNDAYADLAMAVQLDPARESYQTSLTLLKLRLKEAGLLVDGPPPLPVEPRLPEE
jgi:tetratricopeptide (TPR) repeat protein